MTTSCQPRPQPHMSGMAAMSAANGTKTKIPTRMRWATVFCSSAISGRGPRAPAAFGRLVSWSWAGTEAAGGANVAWALTGPLVLSAEVVIVLLAIVKPAAGLRVGAIQYAYVTVSYETVG